MLPCRERQLEVAPEFVGILMKLRGVFKLIVTSRRRGDLDEKLGGIGEVTSGCRIIDLATGEGASEDSKRDIEKFFTDKFAEIREHFKYLKLPPDWPGSEAIKDMTGYAAGLFIWAVMVVKYIGEEAGGSVPKERLEDVLSDIKVFDKRIDGRVQVDRLYARILFDAFRKSTPPQLNKAKGILAAVVLAKEPLRWSDLIQLLSTDTQYSSDIRELVDSTLRVLRPIIPVSDVDGELRVCHKSVSDFLLSRGRSVDAMDFVVRRWNQEMPDDPVSPHLSFILECGEENRRLALACIHLASCNFSLNFDTVAKLLEQSEGPFHYARQYWFHHLECAGTNWIPIVLQNFEGLANAMEVAYVCLRQYAMKMTSAKDEAIVLTKILCDTCAFASQCINQGDYSNSVLPEKLWTQNCCLSYRGDHC